MMPTWPATVPQRLERDGYDEQLGEILQRSAIRGGNPKRRAPARRSAPDTVQGVIRMDETQWLALEAFFETDLKGGVLGFELPDPGTGAAMPEMVRVIFNEPPTLENVGGDEYAVRVDLTVGT